MDAQIMSDNSLDDRYNNRLDRIEQKIDKLSEAMVSIARAEERIVAIEADRQDYWNRLNSHSDKLDNLDARVSRDTNDIKIIERLFEEDRKNCQESLRVQGQRMGEMELRISDAVRTTGIINKSFWVISTGVLAYIGTQILNIV